MAQARKEKTQQKDPGRVCLGILTGAGWVLLIAAVFILGLAKPEANTIADRIYQTTSKREWNTDLLRYLGLVLGAGIGCTTVGLTLYFLGLRTGKYRPPVSLIVTGLLSLAGLIAYLLSA